MEYKRLSDDAHVPTRASEYSAGYDLYSTGVHVIPPRGRYLIKTDIVLQIPHGYYGRIAPRSGLALKYGLDVGAGVIDSDYRGNIGVILFNHTDDAYVVHKHDKIAQIIIIPIVTPELIEVEHTSLTVRGENGYGSSDKKIE